MHSIEYHITHTHHKNKLRQYLHTGSETFTIGLHILSLIEGGCSAPNGISGQAMKAQNTIHEMYMYTQTNAVQWFTVQVPESRDIQYYGSFMLTKTDAVQRSQYTVHTILQNKQRARQTLVL